MGAELHGLVKPTAQAAKVTPDGMMQQQWEGWGRSAEPALDAIVKPPKPQFRGVAQELGAARSGGVVMPKLVIGAPGDAYEQEVDHADTLEEHRPNQTGLPNDLKVGIESLSGFSLDNIKVHYNSSQPTQFNALAYAQGSDIYVAPGQEQHLPHEAWHLVQQAQGRVQPTMQMKDGIPLNDDEELEHEADLMGSKALSQGELHTKQTQIAPVEANLANVTYPAASVADSAIAERPMSVPAQTRGILQLMKGIQVGRNVKVDLRDFGGRKAEPGQVVEAPDSETYLIKFIDAKREHEKPMTVKESLVTPDDPKYLAELSCRDIAMEVKTVNKAIEMLLGWENTHSTKAPYNKLDLGGQLNYIMRGFGETSPKLFQDVMMAVYETPKLQPLLKQLGSIQSTALHPLGETKHTLTSFAELQFGQLGKLKYAPGKGMSGLKKETILSVGKGIDVKHVKGSEKSVTLRDLPIKDNSRVDPEKIKEFAELPLTDIGNVCSGYEKRDWEILGRTVIFHPSEVDKGFVAVKLAKKGEDVEELYKEGGMQRILNLAKQMGVEKSDKYDKQAQELGLDPNALRQLHLRSTFPEPVGVFMLEMPDSYSNGAKDGVSKGIEEQFVELTGKNIYPCFVYRTNDYEYFRYINRAKDMRKTIGGTEKDYGLKIEEMHKGTSDSMHDIFATAGQSWMFTQLIDLYHHNQSAEVEASPDMMTQVLRTGDDRLADGGGRFLVLLDLLRKISRDRGGDPSKTWGMGRVDNITKAVGYPNVRQTGVADVGDARSLDELLGKVKELQSWMEARQRDSPGLFVIKTSNPWKTALSSEAIKKDPKRARQIGFQKPDLELAKDVGAALRRYDRTVWRSCNDNKIIQYNDCGFFEDEIKRGILDLDKWETNSETVAKGRVSVKDMLMESCGLDPSRGGMVNAAYNTLYDPEQDGKWSIYDEALIEEAKAELKKVEGSKEHLEQVEQHELFGDVKHLLYPAEQEGGSVTPYVMAAYLSEYFISHLLLTGTYFCKDEKTAIELKKELWLGKKAAKETTPTLDQLRRTLLGGCVDAVMGFCGLEGEAEFKKIWEIIEGLADFWKLARQVAFFMTDAYTEVILSKEQTVSDETPIDDEDAKKRDQEMVAKMIELGIYDQDEKVAIDDKEHRMRRAYFNSSWNKKKMKPEDSKPAPGVGPDLGTYNGQMPIKEFEVLAYRIIPYLMFKQLLTSKEK